jgi:hypothetical protein
MQKRIPYAPYPLKHDLKSVRDIFTISPADKGFSLEGSNLKAGASIEIFS